VTDHCAVCEPVTVLDGRPMTCGGCGEPLKQATIPASHDADPRRASA